MISCQHGWRRRVPQSRMRRLVRRLVSRSVWTDRPDLTLTMTLRGRLRRRRRLRLQRKSSVKSCNHYLRPKGHTYALPRCESMRSIRSHLSNVASLSTYNVFYPFYVRFYHCMFIHISVSTVTCTYVACYIKYQSINQSIDVLISSMCRSC